MRFWQKRKSPHTILRSAGSALLASLLCLQLVGTSADRAGLGAITPEAMPSWDSYPLVAHAVGSVDEYVCVPSLESFLNNYRQGYRVFECDLIKTADGHLVLRHDWSAGMQAGIDETRVPTLAEFRAAPLYGRYTPLTFADLLELMAAYPDVYIITDSKGAQAELVQKEFSAILSEAETQGAQALLERFIVQLYSPEMYDIVRKVYPFQHYILTLYQTDFNGEAEQFETYAKACSLLGIHTITMWHYLYDEAFLPIMERYHIQVYVHTVNDSVAADSLLRRGVTGVYSDRIDPAALGGVYPQTEKEDSLL